MLYGSLIEAYERISETSKRTEMIGVLVEVLRETPPDLVHHVVYLTQGKLYPDFVPVQMGMAEQLALQAVATAAGAGEAEARSALDSTGDLGAAAEQLLRARGRTEPPRHEDTKKTGGRGKAPTHDSSLITEHSSPAGLTVGEVYEKLDEIARASGKGAQGRKIRLLADLLSKATPVEAKYILRTATGKLRLGLADMTILDALAIAYGGGRKTRPTIERAYNICSDLGIVASAVAKDGVEAVEGFRVLPGKPVRPMLAQRMRSAGEILNTLDGRCQAEYKYDGERIQAHKMGGEVHLFSRRLENITHQYPDAAKAVLSGMTAKEAILEAEVVALNPDTGELRPFQELMRRRRKHRIEEMMAEYPAVLYAFDLLYLDGRDLTAKPLPERRAALEKAIASSPELRPIPARVVDDTAELERYFQEAIEAGTEGLVCKSLKPTSVYEAGGRGWNWIKYKREYVSEMTSAVDLVVVGALHGRGRRGGTYGALLLSAYDPDTDSFPTVTKCGAGFSDRDLAELPGRLAPYRIDHRHPRVNARMKPDVWFVPSQVIEVVGAEITLSPIHRASWGEVRADAGLAIRFPRFTGRFRPDKGPEDATQTSEILQMYESRLRRSE